MKCAIYIILVMNYINDYLYDILINEDMLCDIYVILIMIQINNYLDN